MRFACSIATIVKRNTSVLGIRHVTARWSTKTPTPVQPPRHLLVRLRRPKSMGMSHTTATTTTSSYSKSLKCHRSRSCKTSIIQRRLSNIISFNKMRQFRQWQLTRGVPWRILNSSSWISIIMWAIRRWTTWPNRRIIKRHQCLCSHLLTI